MRDEAVEGAGKAQGGGCASLRGCTYLTNFIVAVWMRVRGVGGSERMAVVRGCAGCPSSAPVACAGGACCRGTVSLSPAQCYSRFDCWPRRSAPSPHPPPPSSASSPSPLHTARCLTATPLHLHCFLDSLMHCYSPALSHARHLAPPAFHPSSRRHHHGHASAATLSFASHAHTRPRSTRRSFLCRPRLCVTTRRRSWASTLDRLPLRWSRASADQGPRARPPLSFRHARCAGGSRGDISRAACTVRV